MHRMPLVHLLPVFCALAGPTGASAHHSYSMFDTSRELSVTGIVAKHEWKNPHAYIWVYVAAATEPTKYEVMAFENGSPSVLMTSGWGKQSVKPNDRITVTYAPLRSGRPGGHCLKVTLADGRALPCVGFAPGAGNER